VWLFLIKKTEQKLFFPNHWNYTNLMLVNSECCLCEYCMDQLDNNSSVKALSSVNLVDWFVLYCQRQKFMWWSVEPASEIIIWSIFYHALFGGLTTWKLYLESFHIGLMSSLAPPLFWDHTWSYKASNLDENILTIGFFSSYPLVSFYSWSLINSRYWRFWVCKLEHISDNLLIITL
jgi:hypothetical protein